MDNMYEVRAGRIPVTPAAYGPNSTAALRWWKAAYPYRYAKVRGKKLTLRLLSKGNPRRRNPSGSNNSPTRNGVNTGGQGRPLYYWHISIGGMRVGAVTATSKTEAIAEARAHWGGDKVARSGRFTARKGKFAGQWRRNPSGSKWEDSRNSNPSLKLNTEGFIPCKAVKIVKHRNGAVQLLIRK